MVTFNRVFEHPYLITYTTNNHPNATIYHPQVHTKTSAHSSGIMLPKDNVAPVPLPRQDSDCYRNPFDDGSSGIAMATTRERHFLSLPLFLWCEETNPCGFQSVMKIPPTLTSRPVFWMPPRRKRRNSEKSISPDPSTSKYPKRVLMSSSPSPRPYYEDIYVSIAFVIVHVEQG